ncbi:phage tail sheath family protein [Herbaspirillum rhizosphaerae]|uniref:phage tail sheath family protein n=1 Tax=Herbaspirillum rhizosphaerae TaxID=346179 RepID=UPI00067DA17E|nr:phage tail sheath C-terminal domain-containing protein [Herbaspirillum rhizosphaerae]
MPTYSSPGVYVEEVPPISRPIAGVSTSTPGFIGEVPDSISLPFLKADAVKWITHTLAATDGMAYRISSWADYVRLFGDFVGTDYATKAEKEAKEAKAAKAEKEAKVAAKTKVAVGGDGDVEDKDNDVKIGSDSGSIDPGQRILAHAVYGFFNNGGTNCYVVRIAAVSNIDKAVTALAAFDDISTVSFPGDTTYHTKLVAHATALQRFAILDLDKDSDVAALTAPDSSTYAGVYFPWLKVFDPAAAMMKETNGIVVVPPSGHIAGIYARSDVARGAYKAPANEALLGVPALNDNITKAQQDVLNVAGINAIRQLNGALRVWGARTVGTQNGEYRYISTRRYFNYLRQSIDSGTQFVVFEPHTPALWQRVIRTLTDFLTNEWRSGALFGETAKQAFFIKCDAETNPASSREQGQLIVEIGVAIVKPAEFVIFRIQQTSGS